MNVSRRRVTVSSLAAWLEVPAANLRATAQAADERYTRYLRAKAQGGRRLISEPHDELKQLQKKLLRRVLQGVLKEKRARREGGITTDPLLNARHHQARRRVVALDLADAFPSTRAPQVVRALELSGFSMRAARLVSKLCLDRGRLPQGAPTSNALLDLVLSDFDREIIRECKRRGIRYTRYVDNLTLSGEDVPPAIERLVERKLRVLGYELNGNKRAAGGADAPVEVTGVLTGSTLKVPPRTYSKARASVERAVTSQDPKLIASARGSVQWVKRVNRRQAAALRKAAGKTATG